MSFLLVRVDDRMIHGQVVVGWASFLHPDRIILCHDEIADSAWEKELYVSSFSDSEVEISVFRTNELLQYVESDDFDKERAILLVEKPSDALMLLERQVPFNQLNIGGIHYGPGKIELISYIFLDAEDVTSLNSLQERGVRILGQDTPSSKKVDVMKLIRNSSAIKSP